MIEVIQEDLEVLAESEYYFKKQVHGVKNVLKS